MALALRPGFVHYATFPEVASLEELRDTLALVRDSGFEVLEVSSRLDRSHLIAAGDLIRSEGGALFLSAGPEFVRTPRALCDTDDAARADAVRRACELIDLAAEIGAENLMLVSGADPGRERRPAARDALARSLAELARYRDRGHGRAVRITVETFPRDRAPAQLLGPTSETVALLTEMGTDVGVTIDLAHLAQLGEDLADSIAQLASRARHVHLSTCVMQAGHPLDGDQHPTFDEPGVALTLEQAAVAVGVFRGRSSTPNAVLSVEIRRHHKEEPAAFLRACMQYWHGSHDSPAEQAPR